MAAQPVGKRRALAIDLGGTQVRAALVDEAGAVLARAEEKTNADGGPDAVIVQMHRLAQSVSDGEVCGVGVSSPGPLDTIAGLALGIPTLKGFDGFAFHASLEDAFRLPVTLENDGIAAAIGEWRHGVGRGRANVVYVTVSTGIGGGVIAGNRVLRGKRGMAGHIGHMSFMAGGRRCFCGNRGCFEAYASGSALAARAAEAIAAGRSSVLAHSRPITSHAVFAAAATGDSLAQEMVADEARMLGQGFASLLHLFNPDVLVMGGGVSRQFGVLEKGIVASLNDCAMPAFRNTPIVPAALGQDSGLLGAAHLAFEAAAAL